MDSVDYSIQSLLTNQLDDFEIRMYQLLGSIEMKSSTPDRISWVRSDATTATFRCSEILVNLPERAAHLQSLQLYLVFSGEIVVDKELFGNTKELQTRSFYTKAGYFRYKTNPDRLKHVYGVHYDIDLTHQGHPRFHAQHCSQSEFLPFVQEHLGQDVPFEDGMIEVMGTVRLPCAQMDFFAVLLQAAADRLIGPAASQAQRDTFDELIELSKSLRGCGHLVASLNNQDAIRCYRSPHWY